MKFTFKNGDKVRDVVTGFEGMVTGRADYISGCNTYLVQPETDKDGKWVESRWFDEPRLSLNGEPTLPEVDTRAYKTGADGEAPRK